MLKHRRTPGFTLVELMIVIVVILVLAGLVTVAYNGIKERARETVLQQELKLASAKIEAYKVGNASEQYPASLNDVEVSSGEGRVLTYNVAEDRQSFCLMNTGNGRSYFILGEYKIPKPGICDGVAGVPGSGNIGEDLAPSVPTVVASTSALKFSWPQTTCVAGMTPEYRWQWQVQGGASGEQTSWTTTREQTVSGEGSLVDVTLFARCVMGNNYSDEVSAEFQVGLPILTTPTLGNISIASDSNASWSGSGCPAGTTLQYQWRRDTAREAGGYNSYTSWGAGTTSGVTISYDDQVTYQVQARCYKAATANSGPVAVKTSSTFTRGIPAPSAPSWIRHVVSNNTTMQWSAVSCAAGYPVYQMWIIRRSTGATQWSFGPSTATSAVRPSLPVASWNSHVRAYCQGTYTSSGWSAENIAYTA